MKIKLNRGNKRKILAIISSMFNQRNIREEFFFLYNFNLNSYFRLMIFYYISSMLQQKFFRQENILN